MRVIHRLIHRLNPVTGNWNVKKRNQLPGAKASVRPGNKVTTPLLIGVVTSYRYRKAD